MQSFPPHYRPVWFFVGACVLSALLSLIATDVLRLGDTVTLVLHAILALCVAATSLWCIKTGIRLIKKKDNRPAAVNILFGAFGIYGVFKLLLSLLRNV